MKGMHHHMPKGQRRGASRPTTSSPWRRGAALAVLLLLAAQGAPAADKCDDPNAIRGWDELRDMRADDPGKPFVEELWALRLKLCDDLKSGRISQEAADKKFEAERERIYQLWQKAIDQEPAFGNEAA